jgi:NAD(P)-dependent dehydrogenase (short-subunit alcohol dehydrogenase family)
VLARFGAAHLLFNNAGIAGVGDAWGGTIDLWDRVIGVNLYGVVHGIRAFLPIMEQQGIGHIVNTASMAGLTPVPGLAPYAATKHAVVGLSESLYLEQQAAGSPIGVSVLCPGFVKTDLMVSEPITVDAPIAQRIAAVLTDGVDNGIPATDVAGRVLEAVDARQFWILTHDDMAQIPVERMLRASTQTNPTALGAAAESEAT